MAERRSPKPQVAGSIPVPSAKSRVVEQWLARRAHDPEIEVRSLSTQRGVGVWLSG